MKLSGQTILIVDDNFDDRFFVERALKRLATGLGAQFVPSGNEAVAYLDGSGIYADRARFPYPSFVITDLDMPLGDGFSVLRHIQALAPALLRVMVLTDSQDPDRIQRAHQLGATTFCTKPNDPGALPAMISTFLHPDSPESVERLTPVRVH